MRDNVGIASSDFAFLPSSKPDVPHCSVRLTMVSVLQLLALGSLISSGLAAQPSAPKPIPAPLRDLHWGQLNFLHTTDIHGWLAGHLQE